MSQSIGTAFRKTGGRPCRLLGLVLMAVASPAWAQQPSQAPQQPAAVEPLARYMPAQDLAALFEHDGFDSQPAAWQATAAYQMLNKTTLGRMLDEVVAQSLDRLIQSAPGAPLNGKDAVELLKHLARKGVLIGYAGKVGPGGPSPQAVAVVIRGAGKNEVFKRVVGKLPFLNEPAAKKVEQPGKRSVFAIANSPIQWWYEKDDAVFAFAPPGANNPVIDVLEGKAPSALKNATYAALIKPKAGLSLVPVGRFFLDLKALPPVPPDAAALGFDGVKRVEMRWDIQGKGILAEFVAQVPRPRRGVFAAFDQPPLGEGTSLIPPKGTNNFVLVSTDLIKLHDAIVSAAKERDPNVEASLKEVSETFRKRTGLRLREDLLSKVGPRMAVLAPPGSGSIGSIFGMWFNPPDFCLLAEVKDVAGFSKSLDALIEVANKELKRAGALVPARPDQALRPGVDFATFRKLKGAEQGYILTVPPAALPIPAGFRPTILLDARRGVLAVAGSPRTARQMLPAFVLKGGKPDPSRDRNAVAFIQSDPSPVLPEILINVPAFVQFAGFSAAQPGAVPPGARRMPAGPPLRIALDPELIPEANDLRQYLFPSKFTMTVDDASIRYTAYQAFPLPAPQINAGAEVPVLVALLLPAVQAAREAARRAQCTNNLKQIGLALHNYHSTNDRFPASAIADKEGKPLLSWRVAILPYLDQAALYERFKLDEPWDSPHNAALAKEMPALFACPSRTSQEKGLTNYVGFKSNASFFHPTEGTKIIDFTDGTSNTMAVVETREEVPWTKPDDLAFDPEAQLAPGELLGASSAHPGGFNVLFADGSVRFIKMSINPQVFKALITKAGGEVISADSY
ncbi:DUF1559 domain-containing protein [Singulisphaera sp. PoT]|uniref:DUF1559 domain-containing protein n=1 Tax=Singulisphaera sp. PoT TaxID=3411797 RepID=UPI003BF52035